MNNIYTNSKESFLIYNLNNYVTLDDGKNRNKINRTNSTLNEILNIEKNKINSYYNNNSSWDKVKKFSNEYEFIYTSSYVNEYKNISNYNPISRSFFKLWEILNNFNFIIPNNIINLKTAHIAEGPGGFIECIYKFLEQNNLNCNVEIHGVTLLSNNRTIPNWKIKKNYISKYNISLNNNDTGNGDLYNIDNINSFMNNVKNESLEYNCCDFITADGGFDFSESFNSQENDFSIFLICEIYLVFNLLKISGNSVIKIYDIYSKDSIKILYILSLFFEEILIIKPLSSRPANSEKYLLCKNYIKTKTYFMKYNELFKNIIKTKDLKLLEFENAPYKFLKHITNYNKLYTNRQIKYIKKTIELINKINNIKIHNDIINERFFLKNIYNINKKYAVEWCNNYNIEIK
jgi:23S rRNA U2552 (ribose-2'-O)-methylase RlmE/FtsJ